MSFKLSSILKKLWTTTILRSSIRRCLLWALLALLVLKIFEEPTNTLARWRNAKFCVQDFDLDEIDTHTSEPDSKMIPPKLLWKHDNASSKKHITECVPTYGTVKIPADAFNPGNTKLIHGTYSPLGCKPRNSVAVIIPLRGREQYLQQLLAHMHPIWQRQGIAYTVFVTTQIFGEQFNKAKVMNAGFKEASKYGRYDCFVFHDVDALLEDDRCLYWCNQQNPRHLCAYADVFNYREVWYFSACRLPGELFSQIKLFGGVTMFTEEQFRRVNGFSNYYWGWGGEDDDMYNRLINKGYEPVNPYNRHCSYTLLQHPHETTNAPTRAKESLVYHSKSRQDNDGLSNVRYKVLSYKFNPLYINITVDVGRPSPRMQDFIDRSRSLWFYNQCIVRMPWNL